MSAVVTIRAAVAGLLLSLLAACGSDGSGSLAPMTLKPEVVKSLERYSNEYVVAPGDQLDVQVFHVPDVSRTVTVRPDGFVSLPTLKEVKAGGLTVPELDADLTQRYSKQLVNPDVTVTVVNPRTANVYVVGEVTHPGPIAVRDAPTVAVAIASSGGIARTAARGKVAVIRLTDDGFLTGYVMENLREGDAEFFMAMSDMVLRAGDIVVVPESGRSQFVRFIQDFINTPTTGINQVLSPYFQYRVLSKVTS